MTDALLWGVQEEYEGAAGDRVRSPRRTVASALAALGAADGRRPPRAAVLVVHPGDRIRGSAEVVTEDGRSLHLTARVPEDMPLGYHRARRGGREISLIVAPRRCHLPARLRACGWAVQLYAARTRGSWGAGDLGDLALLGRWAAAGGASFALLNPLCATTLAPRVEDSPYLPTSRLWRSFLYLRIEDVPGAAELGPDLEPLAAAGRALDRRRLIDRGRVASLKLAALERLQAHSSGCAAFRSWRRRQGQSLESFATFAAIAEIHGGDFRRWPPELRDHGSEAVAAARQTLAERVRFHAWLQWLVDRQLGAASRELPLMMDLPVGVAPGGADVWSDPELFAESFSVGAPPDLFNRLGQDWAQPPWNPWALRARGYAPLAGVLRGTLRHAMGLRLDHVMGLFRLFWVPHGRPPAEGVYVRYPADEMLDVLALESVRARAVVVGEDLGTVEAGMRETLASRNVLSYRLLWFEDLGPAAFPERSLSAVTTHDLPTVAGLWTGADTAALNRARVPVNDEATAAVRARLARVAPRVRAPAAAVVAAYRALAASPSMLVAAALDDAAGVTERPNVPGTTGEVRPNWRLGLPAPLEDLLAAPLARAVAAAIAEGKRFSRPGGGRRGRARR